MMQRWELPAFGRDKSRAHFGTTSKTRSERGAGKVEPVSLNYRDLLILENGVQSRPEAALGRKTEVKPKRSLPS
jgi:hypothetical protein